MNSQVRRYYRKFDDEEIPLRLFYDVISLHETPELSWEGFKERAPDLPRGWYELASLSSADRVNFAKEFWMETLPYVPHIHVFLEKFFAQLDDVGVFLTQVHFDSVYQSEIVYSLRDGSCFFHGCPPAIEDAINALRRKFQESLPEDYLAFLRIHDGFSKHMDVGIIPSKDLSFLSPDKTLLPPSQTTVNPRDLILFYESFNEKCYQCFYEGWTPNGEIGNVCYSGLEGGISDTRNKEKWGDQLAFPTFLDWLIFYLEGVGT